MQFICEVKYEHDTPTRSWLVVLYKDSFNTVHAYKHTPAPHTYTSPSNTFHVFQYLELTTSHSHTNTWSFAKRLPSHHYHTHTQTDTSQYMCTLFVDTCTCVADAFQLVSWKQTVTTEQIIVNWMAMYLCQVSWRFLPISNVHCAFRIRANSSY